MKSTIFLLMVVNMAFSTRTGAAPLSESNLSKRKENCDAVQYKWIEMDCPTCARNDYEGPCGAICEEVSQKYVCVTALQG
jgi:hypothetical protein